MPGYGMAKTAESGSINGGIYQCKETEKPSITFYIHVDDLQAYLDKVSSLGGKTIVPPSPIPGIGNFAMFADPAGNVLGLFKPNMG
jgi:predicted enzyme related to lactoylglutathione lyase